MESKSTPGDCNPNLNLHPSKPMMAFHFVRALSHIQQTSTRNSSFAGRSRRIRRAAYASMAYSTRTRAWSRALLRKLRNRARLQFRNSRRGGGARSVVIPRRIRVARPQAQAAREQQVDQAEILRRLVPGGTGMDFCHLLDETADYIKCLATQVWLMQTVMDSVSNS